MQKRVMILATDGFEQSELLDPKANLEASGIETTIVSPETGTIRGWNHGDWGESVKVDEAVDEADPAKFDALLLPGGQINPDVLRMNEHAVELVQRFDSQFKPIAAICHAPWLLVEADLVFGRSVTGWESIRTDLRNAGAHVRDAEVVVDGNLITSRCPDDIPAFSRTLIEMLDEEMAEAA